MFSNSMKRSIAHRAFWRKSHQRDIFVLFIFLLSLDMLPLLHLWLFYEFIMCQELDKGPWKAQYLRNILWTGKEPGESQNQPWFKFLMDEHFYQKSTCRFLSSMKQTQQTETVRGLRKTTGAGEACLWQGRVIAKWLTKRRWKRVRVESDISILVTVSSIQPPHNALSSYVFLLPGTESHT